MKRRTSPRLGREFFFWADNGQSGSYRATSRGKMVAKADAPDPKAIPWLLVTVTGHSGSGKLSGVTSIQRVNTVGGLAPTAQECTAQSGEVEFKSSYSADYYFYARRA
jgi:hypothetical protein